jgi:hypothetical protein
MNESFNQPTLQDERGMVENNSCNTLYYILYIIFMILYYIMLNVAIVIAINWFELI